MNNNDQFEERIRRSLDRKAESVRAEPDISTLEAPRLRSSSVARRPPMMLALAAAVVLVLGATAMVVQAANERDQQVTASEGNSDNSTDEGPDDPGTTSTTSTTACEVPGEDVTGPCPAILVPPTTVTPETEPIPTTSSTTSSSSTTVAPDTTAPVTTSTTIPEEEPEQPVCPEGFTDPPPPPPVPWSSADWGDYTVVLADPQYSVNPDDDPTEEIMTMGVWAESDVVENCYARLRDSEGSLVHIEVGSGETTKHGLQCAVDWQGNVVFFKIKAFAQAGGVWDIWAVPGKLVGTMVQYSDFESYSLTPPDDAEEIGRAGTIDC